MRRQHDALHLAASLAEINEDDRKEANEKVAKAEKDFHQLAPVALQKYAAKGHQWDKCAMPEMRAVAMTHFMKTQLKGNKPNHIKQMQKLMTDHPSVIPAALNHLESQTQAEVPPPEPTPIEAADCPEMELCWVSL